ncbi:hypothetical protein AB0I66_21455 [Streptomyces sp. NPDC050439]|uniref:hypothetical protein n=1 Tax=unclassified Streptomyces TaxID=2593676 RepID=UPI0034352DCB
MNETPYTDDDLRAEAAHCLAALVILPTAADIRRSLPDTYIDSHRTPDSGPEATWAGVVGEDGLGVPVGEIHTLIEGAADVSEWAINLGADGLQPSTEHEITINSGPFPIARIHFAYQPTTPEEIRTALVEGIEEALDDAAASLDEPEPNESADADSDVFALIAGIASRLRDATDEGEYHAVGLIYDLATGRTTITDAREQLAEITFRHV